MTTPALEARVVEIASASTTETSAEAIASTRQALTPYIRELGRRFARDRAADPAGLAREVELTRGGWKSLFYDDKDIRVRRGPVALDVASIYQFVADGYYYNLSNTSIGSACFGVPLQGFLKGEYELSQPGDTREGLPRANVINLEFVGQTSQFGRLPRGARLSDVVARVESTGRCGCSPLTFPVPGPTGIQGELWNAYVSENLRISFGEQKGDSRVDLYVLRRADTF